MKIFGLIFGLIIGSIVIGAEVEAESATTVVASGSWAPILGSLTKLIIDIFSPVLVILASWATWKLAGKFGFEKNVAMDNVLKSYVEEGISWADQWALKQTVKPTGDQKYAEAVKYILQLVEKSSIPQIAEDRLKAIIEKKLTKELK